ncbi:CG13423 [Drosophila busckii]|uniref:Bleomycin hydrolase n=1 Tax=Drosophila busckii TaxID=30019 RepID=A0A0M5IZU2_DROBS|nr:bleomycin hydrolase [Drosophila busckii]ALC42248.1 CG13423 [Drosophila busckii]
MTKSKSNFTLSSGQLTDWRSQFYASPMNRLAQNICAGFDPIDACRRPEQTLSLTTAVGRHFEVSNMVKPTVDGPKWICAGLDLLRQAMEPECELSAAYLFYWHKLERSHYVLQTVANLLERCEPLDGRTFQYVMKHLVPDGGNWQMFVNLVSKYGVMPKSCYLASWSAKRTLQLNRLLKSKLHEFSSQLHAQFTFDGDASQLPALMERMLEQLYGIINICLGTPATEFSWKQQEQSLQLTPLAFYRRYIQPKYALQSQLCLAHDPRTSSCYGRNYSVGYSSNMWQGLQQCYNNQPMPMLLQIMSDALSGGSPVWLACDLQPRFKAKCQLLSLSLHSFEQLLGLPVFTPLDKATRLQYKDTGRNSVLLLTAATLDAAQQPLYFSSQRQSASEPSGNKTTSTINLNETSVTTTTTTAKRKVSGGSGKSLTLHADWLREYAFEIVVDARFVPPSVLHASRTQPHIELPIWDPMGALLS